MNKKYIVHGIVFVGMLAAGGFAFFALYHAGKNTLKLPAPRPDTIVAKAMTGTTVQIENKTAGYAVTVPKNWYLEKSAGSGMAVYARHDGAAALPPTCKIEISTFSNPTQEDLGGWLSAYMRRDPTMDVVEASRETTMVGGAPAMIWKGALNRVSSTLVYVTKGTNIYELAASAMLGATGNADCEDALKIVLKNFQLVQ